jgi:hypothetical protein
VPSVFLAHGRVAWATRRRFAGAASAAATKEAVISGVTGRTSTCPAPQASPLHPVAERREWCEDAIISSLAKPESTEDLLILPF